MLQNGLIGKSCLICLIGIRIKVLQKKEIQLSLKQLGNYFPLREGKGEKERVKEMRQE